MPLGFDRRRQSCAIVMRRSTSSCAGQRGASTARRLLRLHRGGDNAAAKHTRLTVGRVVKYAGLSGRHAVHTADQLDFEIRLNTAPQPSGLRCARRAHLDVDFGMALDCFADRDIAEPIDVAQANATGPQRFARADHDPARRGIEAYNIERRTRGYAKAAALTHGKMNDAVMTAEHAAVEIDDFARSGGAGTQAFDHVGIAAARHKANVLAVLLVGDGKPEA